MAGIEGSGPIRLGSNSAQIPVLLAKTKPQAFDRPQQEAAKTQAGANAAAPQATASTVQVAGPHNPQMHVSTILERYPLSVNLLEHVAWYCLFVQSSLRGECLLLKHL